MLAQLEITTGHWVGFILLVMIFLSLDLGVFHRKAHVVSFREALVWTAVWCTLSLGFGGLLFRFSGREEVIEFLTGYIIELSLSMDNVFVIALIFGYFRIPPQYQHRVLFWGILGALVMRGFMIGLGVALISMLSWVLYLLGAFLLYSGIKMLFVETEVEPEKNPVIRWVRKVRPLITARS